MKLNLSQWLKGSLHLGCAFSTAYVFWLYGEALPWGTFQFTAVSINEHIVVTLGSVVSFVLFLYLLNGIEWGNSTKKK